MSRRQRAGVPELDELFRKARSADWAVDRLGHGWRLTAPDGRVVRASSSRGAVRGTRTALRRAGLDV